MNIVELTTDAEFRAAFPVMQELRAHLSEDVYLHLLHDMVEHHGYRLFALYDVGQIVALAGIEIMVTLYFGRSVHVHELITTESGRSKGYGRALLGYMDEFARENGCGVVWLSSATHRLDAHRFYEQHMGYERVAYVFRKVVE